MALALAGRPITRRQRVLGRGLDAPGLFGRVLWLFREGMRSEFAGRWRLADFYWQYSRDALRMLLDRPGAWDAVLGLAGGVGGVEDGLPDADGWLRALVDELFIDTHCAFFNGRAQGAGVRSLRDRAFDHAEAIEYWLTSGPTSPEPLDRASLLIPPGELLLECAQAARQWDQAQSAALKLCRLFPDRVEFLDRVVDIEFQRITQGLMNSKYYTVADLADASTLKEGIKRLQAFRREFPQVLSAFDALGSLYHIRAAKLAKGGAVTEALVEARRALDYAPDLEGAKATFDQIGELLNGIIEQGRAISREPGYQYDVELTPERRRIFIEARNGDRPLRAYLESGEPQGTARALAAAKNEDASRRLGHSPPPDRFEEQQQALSAAVSEVLQGRPTDAAEARRTRESVSARDEQLSSIDPERVVRLTTANRSGSSEAEARVHGSEDTAKPTPEPRSEPPILPSPPNGSHRAEEPFDFWLFSRRGIWLKVQAAAAAVLLATGIGMAIQRGWYDRTRDDAYLRVLQAQEARDYLGMIRGIEDFLAHASPWNRDPREGGLRELYNEVMVRWFIGRGGPEDAEARKHVDRYRRLSVGSRS